MLTTCLWFDGNALDVANYYISIFPHSTLGTISYYDEANPHIPGSQAWDVMVVEYTLMGQRFMGLNGGSGVHHSLAVSWIIPCETQAEIDYYYEHLSAVPEAEQCGWVRDQFGISWQITPNRFIELMKSDDKEKSANLMKAMLTMKRLNIVDIERAYNWK